MQLTCQLLKKGQLEMEYNDIPYQLNDNILRFNIDEMAHELDLQNKTFLRENDDYAFFLDIENQTSELTLKREDYHLQVSVEYAKLLTVKNVTKLTYFLETDDNEIELVIQLNE